MPFSPNPAQALSRPDLEATLLEFNLAANRTGYVGTRIFPVVDVGEQSGRIQRIPIRELLTTQDTRRTPGGGYREGAYTFEEFSFATEEHGWTEPIDERLKRLYRRYFDAEVVATERARNIVLQNHEIRVVNAATNPSIFSNAAAGTAWSSHASADPVDDVHKRIRVVRSSCGITPNVIVMDYSTMMHCKECDSVIDRIKYNGLDDPKNVSLNALATLFGVGEVIVSGGLQNTANAAKAASLAPIWPESVVAVGVVARTQDVIEPCVGRTFHWSEDNSTVGGTVETYYDIDKRCDKVRVRMETDELVVYRETWSLITGAVA